MVAPVMTNSAIVDAAYLRESSSDTEPPMLVIACEAPVFPEVPCCM